MTTPPTLSIVIPAYKATFLATTLDSLCHQNCSDFEVIVADDASPYELKTIFDGHSNGLNAHYYRFDKNFGHASLTNHWDRAVALASGAWILLLGDDDLLDKNVVAGFYKALSETNRKYDIYRFNTRQINAIGQVEKDNPKHPPWESAGDFLRARMRGLRASYTCEYIFSRSAFLDNNGFISFPLAWCSDDATWIALAAQRGIYTIPHAMTSWRLSGENISAQSDDAAMQKLEADLQYLAWIKKFFTTDNDRLEGYLLEFDAITIDGLNWFYRHLYKTKIPVGFRNILTFSYTLAKFTGKPKSQYIYKLAKHDLRCLVNMLMRPFSYQSHASMGKK